MDLRRTAITTIATAAVTALLAACGGGKDDDAATKLTTPESPAARATLGGVPQTTKVIKVAFTQGEQLATIRRVAPANDATRVQTALTQLLAGPTSTERARRNLTTTIPADTTLEGLGAKEGTVTVTLSGAFLRDAPKPGTRARAQARAQGQPVALPDAQTLAARITQVQQTVLASGGADVTKVVIEAGGQTVGTTTRSNLERPSTPPPPTKPNLLAGIAQAPDPETGSTATLKAATDAGTTQARLIRLRFLPPEAATGRFDYRTTQAVIAFQAWSGLDRDGVVGPLTAKALKRAKLPRAQNRSQRGRRAEVYRSKGVVLLLKNGRLYRAIHTATGGPNTPTPSGTYSVFRKELRSWSVPFKTWLPYASYFNNGIAFHEYPDVPPYPASHGCARIPAPEAPVVYDFLKIGSTVAVY